MTQRVILHVGTSKSGTTYLQQRMMANAARLREHGVLWPGPAWFLHVRAVHALRRVADGGSVPRARAWRQLMRQVRRFDGPTAVISMEWMSMLSEHQRRLLLTTLGDVEIEVVITARDLLRQVPSQWQQSTRSFHAVPFSAYATELRQAEPASKAARNFWKQHDVARLVRDWSALVGVEHVHLVTVPASSDDPLELWRRFCRVLGIDPEGFVEGARTNPSMGIVSTELMLRLNRRARRQGMTSATHAAALRDQVSVGVMPEFRHDEGPVSVPEVIDTWARERAEAMIADVRASGVEVIGDLDDLRPGKRLSGRDPDSVSTEELLETAERTIIALAERAADEKARLQEEIRALQQPKAVRTVARSQRVRALAQRVRARLRRS